MNWKDITLGDFIQVNQINAAEYTYDIDREINLYALISKKEVKEIEQMPIVELRKELNKLSFMNKLPDKKIPARFIHSGKVWDVQMDMRKLTGGQVIDIMNFYTQAGTDILGNSHKFMSIVCVPRKSFWRKGKYNGEKFEEYSSMMLSLGMDKAYPIMLFFSKVGENLLPTIENYLKQMREEMKTAILNNGDGTKPLTNSADEGVSSGITS